MTNIADRRIELHTNHKSDRIALRGVRLSATLSGGSLEARLEQTFVNLEPKAIEAIYTFPLPETAAVCGFEVRTGEHVLTGRVEESDEAVEQYDTAIADGHAAYLLEQDRPDVFTVRAGNLKPKQAATIGISYIAPLERVDRSIRVRFPTTIAPRYVSAAGSTDPLQTAMDADALNPPHVLHVPYGVEMRVEVRLGPEVRGITSPSHALSVERPSMADQPWVVTFIGKLAEMDRDIVLELEMARETEPQVQVADGPDEAKYLALTFLPEFDEPAADHRPSETVFVVDCSGSMQGTSIQQANSALELCLRSLTAGDAFNVCRFGSTFEMLSPDALTYSAATLEQAIRFIRRDADLGGTEIYAPLEAILSRKPGVGSVRNVVLLTDGQVTNEPAVIELARKWSRTNRLFTFGIGSSASGYLVRSLARVTRGAVEFIAPQERIEDKVLRTFSRIGSPQVSEVTVKWGDLDLQTPAEIPAVFDGEILRVFARAPGRLLETVALECTTPVGRRSWSLAVGAATSDGGVIARSWAREMIQTWEDADEPANTSPTRRESTTSRRLVSISKQFGILCSRTSFIAVEHRTLEERNNGLPELRRVPVLLASGWGQMREQDIAPHAVMYCKSASSLAAPARSGARLVGDASGSFGGAAASVFSKLRKGLGSFTGVLQDSASSTVSQPPASGGSDDENFSLTKTMVYGNADALLGLLALQSAEGSFDDDCRDVLRTAKHDVEALRAEVESRFRDLLKNVDSILRDQLLNTIFTLVALGRWFADRESLWRRADRKARAWLMQTSGLDAPTLKQMLGEVVGTHR